MRFGALSRIQTPLLLVQMRPVLGFSPDALQPAKSVATVRSPLLVIAGSEDRHTTLADTHLLFDAAPRRKQIWILEAVAHEDFFEAEGEEYEKRVGDFIDEVLACSDHTDTVGSASIAPKESPSRTVQNTIQASFTPDKTDRRGRLPLSRSPAGCGSRGSSPSPAPSRRSDCP